MSAWSLAEHSIKIILLFWANSVPSVVVTSRLFYKHFTSIINRICCLPIIVLSFSWRSSLSTPATSPRPWRIAGWWCRTSGWRRLSHGSRILWSIWTLPGLPEYNRSYGVPNLHLDSVLAHVDNSRAELYSDGGLGVDFEPALQKLFE